MEKSTPLQHGAVTKNTKKRAVSMRSADAASAREATASDKVSNVAATTSGSTSASSVAGRGSSIVAASASSSITTSTATALGSEERVSESRPTAKKSPRTSSKSPARASKAARVAVETTAASASTNTASTSIKPCLVPSKRPVVKSTGKTLPSASSATSVAGPTSATTATSAPTVASATSAAGAASAASIDICANVLPSTSASANLDDERAWLDELDFDSSQELSLHDHGKSSKRSAPRDEELDDSLSSSYGSGYSGQQTSDDSLVDDDTPPSRKADGSKLPSAGAAPRSQPKPTAQHVTLSLVEAIKDLAAASRLRIPKCPQYDGNGDVDHYIENARVYLKQFPKDTSAQKVELLLTGLTGKARAVVLAFKDQDLNTPFKTFQALKANCGKKLRPVDKLAHLKQAADEPSTMFGCRVRRYAISTKMCTDTSSPHFDKFCLGFFTNGAKPSAAKRLKTHKPRTFRQAVRLCKDLDDETTNVVGWQDELNGIDSDLKLQAADSAPTAGQLMQMMLAMQKQNQEVMRQLAHGARQPASKTQFPTRQQGGTQGRRNQIECFHCKRFGHGYAVCREATEQQKQLISQERAQEASRRRAAARELDITP